MRFLIPAGLALGLVTAACGDDSPSPVDFDDPAAITANLDAVGSAFESDVFRSFNTATFSLDAAAPSAPLAAAPLVSALKPQLERIGGRLLVPTIEQSRQLQAWLPELSATRAEGLLIPDSLYGRVFEWDESLDQYAWDGATVSGLTGVRFELYAVDLSGAVLEPTTQIGTLDIIDQSVTAPRLQILVRDLGGTTFIDYTIAANSSGTSVSVSGLISNGQEGDANRTLTFNQTFTVSSSSVRIDATFTLNNPALTLALIETVTFDDPNVVVDIDFRITQQGETIRLAGRITIDTETSTVSGTLTVYQNGGPVASISGEVSSPSTVWVDAGGEPLTAEDLEALDGLFAAMEAFGALIAQFFEPFAIFSGEL